MQEGYSICFNEWALDKGIKNELGLLLIISSLCAEKGYCFASNKYLSQLFDIPEQTISRKIKLLENKNYITIEYKKRGCEIIERNIRLTKLLNDDKQKCVSTINKIVKDNNININNTSNNIYNNNIYDFIEENFGRTLNPLEYEEISTWEDNELTRYAIKEAILGGKYNIKYISVVLHSYKMNNIKTVQQAQEEKERFKNKGKKEEPVPSWFNQEIKKEEGLTDEQRREFEEWKKQI